MKDHDRNFTPPSAEWLVMAAMLLAGFIFNLATYNLYPTVWADEVLWSEPAINLVKTGHFTTSVWQFQRAGSFWAAQSPLYCFLLAGWMKLCGTDLLAARSFNFALVGLGAFLTWMASWRCGLISRPFIRLWIVPLLLCGYGMSFSYRCSRPDILGMVCLLCFGLAFLIRKAGWRSTAVFISAFAAPWVGIQVGLFVAVSCALAKVFFKQVTWSHCILSGAGAVLGLGSMLAFFHAHGVLADLMASISQAAHETEHWGGAESYWTGIPNRLRGAARAYTSDVSGAALLGGLILLAMLRAKNFFSKGNQAARYLAAIIVVIPLVFCFTGHFAFYYSYMIYVPLVLLFLGTLDSTLATGFRSTWTLGTGIVSASAACLIGLPLRLSISTYGCDIVTRGQYSGIIGSALTADDVVFADYPAFFECKGVAHQVYSPMYSRQFVNLSPKAQEFTDKEKRELTVLVIPTSKFAEMKTFWGGQWKATTAPLGDSLRAGAFAKVPFFERLTRSYLSNPQSIRQPIQVFRRDGHSPVR